MVDYVDKMIGHTLTTKQTPPGGVKVKKVMIAEALNIVSEKYFAILLDWNTSGPLIVGSQQGGMDIEEVATKTPDAIFKVGCISVNIALKKFIYIPPPFSMAGILYHRV